jgi:hypothetical protein
MTEDGSRELFCAMFTNCQEEAYNDDFYEGDDVDCDSLTRCEWDGKRPEFIGDGVCDMWTAGCYNTAVCGYDGGDCCEDKCESGEEAWAECGSNGFYCADVESPNCDPEYNDECAPLPTPPPPEEPDCPSSSTLVKILQYDSWGDGWNEASMSVWARGGSEIYSGGLEDGAEAFVYACLADGCYDVTLSAGDWGNEISWEVRPSAGGSLIASGGAPASCSFPIVRSTEPPARP